MMKKVIILFFIVLTVCKFLLASQLSLFGDEAFYWQCAQRPSFSYIDHPPITAMFVKAGTEILGDTSLGVRLLFLLCGMAFPFAVYALARPIVGDRNSWLASGASLVFPGTAYLGLVAIPDVPMLLFSVLAVACFERATREGSTRFWVMAGVLGVMGFLTHYRFILLPASAVSYLVLTSRGRKYLRKKEAWIAGCILLFGLVPILLFNLQTDFEPLRYYLAGRHAMSFSFEKFLRFIAEQVLMATPPFFIALMSVLVVLFRKAREMDDRAILFFIFAVIPLFVFIVASPFEDSGLTTVHWPVPGYVYLFPFLPATLSKFVKNRPTLLRKLSAGLVPGLSGILLILASVELGFGVMNLEILHRPFSGWSAVAEKIQKDLAPDRLNESSRSVLVAADTYVLGANLDFLMRDPFNIYVLDHPKNTQHGRAYQYHIWDMDEQALLNYVGRNVLLIIEETALRHEASWKFQQHVCSLFKSVDYLGDMYLENSRRRFMFLFGHNILDDSKTSGQTLKKVCKLGIFSCLDTPKAESMVSGMVKISGWAFKDNEGVTEVTILINGHAVGAANYGISRPDVKKVFAGSLDPNQPNVGFEFYWDSSTIKPGTVEMAVKVNTADGRQRILNQRKIIVAPLAE